jgi:hypothetical protein
MNKNLMKRKHMEESNILLQNRLKEETYMGNTKINIEKNTLKKEFLTNKLIGQLKNGG